ncbi:MAG: hypothetical protein Q9172_005461 [Xanthocarpia lactea]
MNPSVPTSAFGFFSLPVELRREIYSYLIPTAVHVSPSRRDLEGSNTPWALASVSRQFRDEIRQTVYGRATIKIHIDTALAMRIKPAQFYEAWIDGLGEGFVPLVKHLVIDRAGGVELESKPGVEAPKASEQQFVSIRLAGCAWKRKFMGMLEKCGKCKHCRKHHIGPWQIRWRGSYNIDAVKRMLTAIITRNENWGRDIKVTGLGKEDIRRLVTAYR